MSFRPVQTIGTWRVFLFLLHWLWKQRTSVSFANCEIICWKFFSLIVKYKVKLLARKTENGTTQPGYHNNKVFGKDVFSWNKMKRTPKVSVILLTKKMNKNGQHKENYSIPHSFSIKPKLNYEPKCLCILPWKHWKISYDFAKTHWRWCRF